MHTLRCLLFVVQYVDKEFGTGVLKISPGHDHNDYLLARKIGLPILNVMNKDGTLNEVAGLYWYVSEYLCTPEVIFLSINVIYMIMLLAVDLTVLKLGKNSGMTF